MSMDTKILVNKVPVIAEDCPFCREVQHYGYVCSVIGYSCQLENGTGCPCLMSYAEYDRERTNKYIQTLDGKRVLIPKTKRTSRGVKMESED